LPAGRPSRLAGPALGIGAALVIFLTGPLLLFHPLYVGSAQEQFGVAESLGIPPSDVERLTGSILRDIFTGGSFEASLDGTEPFLNASERSHMTDVSGLARTLAAIDILALALAIWAAWALRRDRHRRGRALVIAASTVGVLAILASVAATVAFEPLFIAFHGLFFAAGTWSFPPGSHLTGLFPEALFSEAAILAGALILVSAGAVALVGFLGLRRPDRC